MKQIILIRTLLICILLFQLGCSSEQTTRQPASNIYLQNKAPLHKKPYLELPLGTIKPTGWLLDQLERMRDGMTGNLDEIYPEVMGPRNGWLGGDGDGWERGPYWIDGLLPLAYILDDEQLKEKVQPWIEWTLNNQSENGYLGPIPFLEPPAHEPGLQRGMRKDWWPKMVMLKILQQYYNATKDERVIEALTNYFQYQLKELPTTPLDNWTLWANRRGGDNLMVVYWLYNITADTYLLELGKIIKEQTFPWTQVFLNEENYIDPVTPWHYTRIKRYPFDPAEIGALTVSKIGGMHCVNFAQSLKQPIVCFQHDQDIKHIKSVKKALADVKKYHGQPQGMYGGDEPLHGTNPIQGVEFCSVMEEMFSLETILPITGDMEFADLLEKIVYNALPAQTNEDFTARQYFQAANQVELSDKLQTSYQTIGHGGTDFVFGTLTGYPCCTSNMHQGWPKFVQNLWYATADGGVAAFLYGPSEVRMKVADNVEVYIVEATGYPFREQVNFKFKLEASTSFPFHLRIPSWANDAAINVNGKQWNGTIENQIAILDRRWSSGDEVTLTLPMKLKTSRWHDFSVAVERGPLVHALKIQGEEKVKDRNDKYRSFIEVYPKGPWNYGLVENDLDELQKHAKVEEKEWDRSFPWTISNAPLEVKLRGIRIDEWKLTNGAPYFPAFWSSYRGPKNAIDTITLIPYGCTTLRITEFPTYHLAE